MHTFFILIIIAIIFLYFSKKKGSLLFKRIAVLLFVLTTILFIARLTGVIDDNDTFIVEVSKAEKNTITELVSASGKIQPEIEVKISPDVSGQIVALPVIEGDKVSEGDLLVKIKPDIYQSMLERAKASLNTAKANLAKSNAQFMESESNYNRNKKLFKDEAISEYEFEQIESVFKVASLNVESSKYAITSAEASVKEAQENLEKTAIYAPVSGTISRLNVELGERVVGTGQMSGTELMRLADLEAMEVAVEVNENDIVRVERYDTTQIEVDAFFGKKFNGIVTEIANSANILGVSADQVTNFMVKIRVLDKVTFRPGMTATVDIETQRADNVLAIPIQAVTTRNDTVNGGQKVECVFVVDNGRAVLKKVKTGIQDMNNIQVISGIQEGDQVITSPYSLVSKLLEDGMKVRVQ